MLSVELQGRSNIIQYAARQLIIKTAVTPRAQLGSCQSLAHQATCAFMRFLSSDCWAPLSLEPQGRSTIVQSTIDHKSLDENVLFDETEADSTHRCSAGKKITSPSASQVRAHPSWPQTTSLARGDPTSPSWRQLGKHTSAHQPIDKGGQRSAPQECAPHFPPPASSHYIKTRAIAYARVFDATLGFPGEGPLIVATYNINGTRGSLAAVLAQAKLAKIDILLLQELHFYEDGEHGRVGHLADRQGWTLVHSPATRIDPSSGVAIAVRMGLL